MEGAREGEPHFALRVRTALPEPEGYESPPPTPALEAASSSGDDGGGGEASGEDADRLGFFGGDTLLGGGSGRGGSGAGAPPPDDDNEDDDAPAELPDAPRPLPFEFLVLEAALEAVCTRLEADVAEAEAAAHPALDALTQAVTKTNLERVKRARGALARLFTRVQTARAEVQRLLDDDSDMRDMHLTRKQEAREHTMRLWLGVRDGNSGAHAMPHAEPHRLALAETLLEDDDDIQELEDLLETYFAQIDHCYNRLVVLRQVIEDTEDYVNIDLDSKRNKILEFNVLVGLAALAHGLASTVYGVFGMNFILPTDSGAVPDPGGKKGAAFKTVASVTAVLAIMLWLVMIWTLRWYNMVHIVPLPTLRW